MSKTLIERIIECRVKGEEKEASKLFEQLVDENSFTEVCFDIDLEEDDKHPGFDKVADEIADKEGVSKEEASAILAASSRNASAAAKHKNPRLGRVSEADALRGYMNVINEANETEYFKYIANGEEFIVAFADEDAKTYTDLVFKWAFGTTPEKVKVKVSGAADRVVKPIKRAIFQRSLSFDDLIRNIEWHADKEDCVENAKEFYDYRLKSAMQESNAKKFLLNY